jgi:serine/threonine-protein kinase PknG
MTIATSARCAATPGCPGHIDADGYCDECGMAAQPHAGPADGTAGAANGSSAAGSPAAGSSGSATAAGSSAASSPAAGPPAAGSPGSATAARAAAPASPPAAGRPAAGSPCAVTPGCPGHIDADGYCDECGMAAQPHAASAAPAAPAGSARTAAGSARTGVGSTRTGSTRTGTARTGSSRSSRRRIGRGLVAVEPVPVADPSKVVLANPEVPEDKRYCSNCGKQVGRSRPDRPARLDGFCPNCGTHFSFSAKLKAGDLVADQYRIAGPLAHGGMGWIYLATDTRVADRWVVLKGLLDAGDAGAAEAAMAERRFLAEVEHPNTVKIYNFAEHDGAGYIVMEYVGGRSLKDVLKQRRAAAGRVDPLPVPLAVGYLLDIMPAFTYLHEKGLLYCDFKPDNLIQTADAVKLIDLGAVIRIGDEESAVFGTVGFQAPEVATAGPSIESDLYTVGRTLAVLCTDFRGYQSTFVSSLPDPVDQPVFGRYPSLYGFLVRACHPDPDERFHSAEEMADQLLGVLREALAIDGNPQPGPSGVFTGERSSALDRPDVRALPVPLVDTADPNAAFLATVTVADPQQLIATLGGAPQDSPELGRRAVLALLSAPDAGAQAASRLSTLAETWGRDWQTDWLGGLLSLAQDLPDAAQVAFERVRDTLPGELAPKLALGMVSELREDWAGATRWYGLVSTTDPAYTSAAAGLGRVRAAAGDRAGAVSAFDRIPSTSSAWSAGQVAAVRALVAHHEVGGAASAEDLVQAATLIDGLRLATDEAAALRVEVLSQALAAAQGGRPLPGAVLGRAGGATAGGATADERGCRLALEGEYRILARAADNRAERIRLVDMANAVRPRTLT